MEVKVTRIDAEPLGELAVRQVLPLALPEHLEHAEPQRVTEGLQLLCPFDREDVE
jgi:hypothetical protein